MEPGYPEVNTAWIPKKSPVKPWQHDAWKDRVIGFFVGLGIDPNDILEVGFDETGYREILYDGKGNRVYQYDGAKYIQRYWTDEQREKYDKLFDIKLKGI